MAVESLDTIIHNLILTKVIQGILKKKKRIEATKYNKNKTFNKYQIQILPCKLSWNAKGIFRITQG